MPEASGTAVLGAEPLIVDVSHTDQGYIMAQYTGDADKANIQIDGPDGINYKYFITSGPLCDHAPYIRGRLIHHKHI